ncbi:TetR family transcriptional regulator C-terminal domain-containing protein [Oryzibacter oryziterrae]|uniref:TetR family transcriptional regulator C-terminal domain-containing protein n=1 Tax=Oryzibacter oryziterrae TaxID=2766474 RepID=UPI001F02AAEE|nr:TetR family transcriptional regulator C-terminal domain-containing protein [Oryzibacter oryziterrae]
MHQNAAAENNSRKSDARLESERAILTAAESVFAEFGFKGATTALIAERAGLPKANLHYYFPTKESLYRRVVDRIFRIWLEAARSFDDCDDPAQAISRYVAKKMEISRDYPNGSKIWASEIMMGGPVMQDYLETTLREWTQSRIDIIDRWIAEGRVRAINGRYLLYLIWAATQHYADFGHQIATLNGGEPLDDAQFCDAQDTLIGIILRGIGINQSG